MDSETYADWLLEVALNQGAGLVLPYRRREELSVFRDKFEAQGIRLLVAAGPEVMRLLEDKPTFLGHMEAAEVAITPFRLFEGPNGYDQLRKEEDIFPSHPGPLCVKPTLGIYGAGFRIIRDKFHIASKRMSSLSTLELSETAFRALLSSFPRVEPMMLMPFFKGSERSVDFACYEGCLLGTVTRIKEGTTQLLVHDPHCENLAELIARIFRLTGVLNLQTIEDASGLQRLMEVNSRTSGGIGMTGLTNVNLPGLLLKAIEGRVSGIPIRVEREVRVGRREHYWPI